jgi:hypothetical protein
MLLETVGSPTDHNSDSIEFLEGLPLLGSVPGLRSTWTVYIPNTRQTISAAVGYVAHVA